MADEPLDPAAGPGAGPGPNQAANPPLNDQQPCQNVVGQAEIDGTQQQISGLACRQPDGTWQIQQAPDGSGAAVYPGPYDPDYAYGYDSSYPYPYPGYWGPPIAFGIGASFVFVDRFNHFHRINHIHYGRPYAGHWGGWRGGGHWGGGHWGGGFHGGGGMHGGGGHGR